MAEQGLVQVWTSTASFKMTSSLQMYNNRDWQKSIQIAVATMTSFQEAERVTLLKPQKVEIALDTNKAHFRIKSTPPPPKIAILPAAKQIKSKTREWNLGVGINCLAGRNLHFNFLEFAQTV